MILSSENPTLFTRREFLKQSVFSLAGLAVLTHPWLLNGWQEFSAEPKLLLGRVLKPKTQVYAAPNFSSRKLDKLTFNTVLNLPQSLLGEVNQYRNNLWYGLQSGSYIHSSAVQIVEERLNPVINKINRRGQLAEVTVPYTQAWKGGLINRKAFKIFYFGSNHWVNRIVEDEHGVPFYRIIEDRWGDIFYVQAIHMHLFAESELNPISFGIPADKKRIEVNLNDQMVYAFEADRLVWLSPISSGSLNNQKDFSTPKGEYEINYKRPSRHMQHGDRTGFEDQDLYGVPWVSYFTNIGIAFHGAYWHNDFGYPRSHGCVNLPIPAAKWLYLWSQPVVPPLERKYVSNHGTPVRVI